MKEQRFSATIDRVGEKSYIFLPFDPNVVWVSKARHHVAGAVNGCKVRGELINLGSQWALFLGPAWLRDAPMDTSGPLEIVLYPEGPQSDELAQDIRVAFESELAAKQFFDSLPTFYRENFMRAIDQAKQAKTRAKRINEMIELLKAGKREK